MGKSGGCDPPIQNQDKELTKDKEKEKAQGKDVIHQYKHQDEENPTDKLMAMTKTVAMTISKKVFVKEAEARGFWG